MQSIQWIGLSPLWWLVFVGIGGGVAWLIYRNESRISVAMRRVLGILRAITVTLCCFLLAQLYWKITQSETLAPAWWIVWDQSRSMLPHQQATQQIRETLNNLSGETHHIDLSGKELSSWQTPADSSSPILSGLMRLSSSFLTSSSPRVLLISDGLVNEGVRSAELPFPLYTIGVGDTTLRPDSRVKRLAVNERVTLGNQFQIESDIEINQFKGKSLQIHLTKNGQIIQSRNWASTSQKEFLPWVWTATADEKGSFVYGVKISVLPGESNASNNEARKPVEVVENKQKILILAHSPHPDIRSLKVSLLKSNQFDVEEWIIPAVGVNQSPMRQPYAAVILHQLPSRAFPLSVDWISQWKAQGIPLFFIVGNETNLAVWNGVQNLVGIQSGGNRQDRARGRWVAEEDPVGGFLSNLDPLLVPFGTYVASKEPEVWMDQLIGTVPVNRPLLLVGGKEAVLTGEGIWKWRIEVAENPQQVNAIDQLWIRLMQRLVSPSGQARLQVTTEKSVFSRGEKVSFWAETWDRTGQPLSGTLIDLTLRSSNKTTKQYQIRSNPQPFALSGLEAGSYSFTATATCDGLPQKVEGSFLIENKWMEDETTQADFAWLREIAQNNKGEFVARQDLAQWVEKMNQNPPPGKISVRETRKKTIDLPWLGGLLVLLLALEWVLRKYLGLY